MQQLAAEIFRDFNLGGVPSSGLHEPEKHKIRSWGTWLESLANLAFTSSLVYSTRAALYANLVPGAATPALVIGDPTAGHDGLYGKVGATGTGSWTRLGDVPGRQLITCTDAGAGTANAIQLTSSIPAPASAGAALFIANVFEANTAAVTISLNGAAAKPLVTNDGNALASGYLTAGRFITFIDQGTQWRLLTDVVSGAIVAAADAARVAAETAASSVSFKAAANKAAIAGYNPTQTTLVYRNEAGFEGFYKPVDPATIAAIVAADTAGEEVIATANPSLSYQRVRLPGAKICTTEFGGGNDGILLALAVAEAYDRPVTVLMNQTGVIAPSAFVRVPKKVSLEGPGSEHLTLSFGHLAAGQLYLGKYGFCSYGSLIALPGFTSINKGDTVIALTAGHGLAPKDVIVIYDSADGSWLPNQTVAPTYTGGREYYRRGMAIEVMDLDGNNAHVEEAINDNYPSGGTVTLYKLDGPTGNLSGFDVRMEGSPVADSRAILVKHAIKGKYTDIGARDADYASMFFAQCFRPDFENITAQSDVQSAQANQYPFNILNCTRPTGRNITARGKWNGFGTGGEDEIGAIPTRMGHLTDCVFSSSASVPGCDIHGNTDGFVVEKSKISNGVKFGGRDIIYDTCEITDAGGTNPYLLTASEIYGGVQEIRNCLMRATKDPTASRATLDMAGGNAFASAKEETFVTISGTLEYAGGLTDNTIKTLWVKHNAGTFPVSCDLDLALTGGIKISSELARFEQTGGSGTATHNKLKVSGLASGKNYSSFTGTYAATTRDYPRQQGTRVVALAGGANLVDSAFAPPHGFPVAPLVRPVITTAAAATPCFIENSTIAANSLRFTFRERASGGGLPTGNATITWDASINQDA